MLFDGHQVSVRQEDQVLEMHGPAPTDKNTALCVFGFIERVVPSSP